MTIGNWITLLLTLGFWFGLISVIILGIKMKRPWWTHWPWNWAKALDKEIDDMIEQLGDIFGHDQLQKRIEDFS